MLYFFTCGHDEVGKFIDEQSAKWAKVVKENNIRAGE
jgi:hypothetical protein